MTEQPSQNGFKSLNLPHRLTQILDRLQFSVPTPIQSQAIPPALEGRDIVGIAQTGTGKTLAFGLPIAANLAPGSVALILAPTRELAIQIQETFAKLFMKTAVIIGGAPMGKQIRELRSNPSVIVATPGRLIDHLNQRTAHLGRVSMVVLDEADRMFDMGFAPAIRTILDQVPSERQTMMFSATMPEEIRDLAAVYLREPVRIEIERPGTAASNVSQELWTVAHEDKQTTLEHILYSHQGTTLVFARTRHGARKLAKSIRGMGFTADELHSDRTLAQRRQALHSFKSGGVQILVATDIAARGIDVKEIGLVLNYDIPENPEDYVHRIGRTGRAGADGRAITLATPQQHRDVRDIERLLKTPLAKFNATGVAERGRIDERSSARPVRNERRPQPAVERVPAPVAQMEEPIKRPEPRENQARPVDSRGPRKPYAARSFDRPAPNRDQDRSFDRPREARGYQGPRNDDRGFHDNRGFNGPREDRGHNGPRNDDRSFNGPRNENQGFNGPRENRGYNGPRNNDRRFNGPRNDERRFNGPRDDRSFSGPSNANPRSNDRRGRTWEDRAPQNGGDWKANPSNRESGSADAPPKRKGVFTPKQFKSPAKGKGKKPKSHVTRQLIAKAPKPGGSNRFERAVKAAGPASFKRKSRTSR